MMKKLNHVGIILDGNRRWAKKKDLIATQGHMEGAKTLKKILRSLYETDIRVVSLYIWSLKNHKKRSLTERNFIFNKIIKRFFNDLIKETKEKEVKIVLSGRWKETELKDFLDKKIKETEHFDKKILNFCFMYDGQNEIVDSVKEIINSGIKNIDKETIRNHLYVRDLPPVDLIIRTGMSDGQRLSGFLLWDSSYAEFIFHETFWPDYNEEMLMKDIEEYHKRTRRFGK